MSCVVAVFNHEFGVLASDGRVTSLDAQGKIVIGAEDAFKHLQLDERIAVATAGVGTCAVPVLRMIRDVHGAFRGRCGDLLGGLEEFTRLIPKPGKGDFADAPVPLAIVFLAAEPKSGNLRLRLLHGANDYQGQSFHCSPGGSLQIVILSPCDETTNFIHRRLNGALPEIFKKRGQSLVREAKEAIRLAIADAAKNDQRINGRVGFATVWRADVHPGVDIDAPPPRPVLPVAPATSPVDSLRSWLEFVSDCARRIWRFYVGSIITPADGAPDTVGNDDGGATPQTGTVLIVGFDSTVQSSYSGNGVLTDLDKTNDRDMRTYGEGTVTGNSSGVNLVMFNLRISFDMAFPLTGSLKLKVRSSFPTNSLNGTGDVGKIEYSIDGSTFSTIATVTPGQTRAMTTDAVDLPPTQVLNRIILMMTVRTFVSQTSGTLIGRLCGAWLEGRQ